MSPANIFEPALEPGEDDPAGFRTRAARVGALAGGQNLGATVYELPPGEALCPYHWHEANEEMAIVLSGNPTVRMPDGWRELQPGEMVAFRRGQGGAHQVANHPVLVDGYLVGAQMLRPLIKPCLLARGDIGFESG